MEIRFWGVRGSIGVSGPNVIRYGGHTSCIEVMARGKRLILDAGSGLRLLGNQPIGTTAHHVLFTHYHFDHICGLVFFRPIHQSGQRLHLYGPKPVGRSMRSVFTTLFRNDYFPINLRQVKSKIYYHALDIQHWTIGNFRIESLRLNHPGHTFGYIISSGTERMAYLCDHEPIERHNHLQGRPGPYEQLLEVRLQGVQCLIHDGQYTQGHYPNFVGWGHSPWNYAIELARRAQIPRLILTHFAPEYDDAFLKRQSARFRKRTNGPIVLLAREGLRIKLN